MIITRTPYRISFLGGGTDYPIWYNEHGGKVISTTIDKYCFIFVRKLAQFFEHKYRIVYGKTELVDTIDEIENDRVRECLKYLKIKDPLEICYIGELPARSGSGSSSVFTVGLLNALHCYAGTFPCKYDLSQEAIHVEQEVLKENVGSQDQMAATFGGLNYIKFSEKTIAISPVIISRERIKLFNDHLLLFFTKITRDSSALVSTYMEDLGKKKMLQRNMSVMVEEGLKILSSDTDIRKFGELLEEAWEHKKQISPQISNSQIDVFHAVAKKHGAIGGKITGAGGGGMLLFFAEPKHHQKIINSLSGLVSVPFKFEFSGTTTIFCER